MKTETLYVCEGCRTEYKDKDKCSVCENMHQKAIRIVGWRFRPNEKYPTKILVSFEDNKTRQYKLIRDIGD